MITGFNKMQEVMDDFERAYNNESFVNMSYAINKMLDIYASTPDAEFFINIMTECYSDLIVKNANKKIKE